MRTRIYWMCTGCEKHGEFTIELAPHHPLFLQELHERMDWHHGPADCGLTKVDYFDRDTRQPLWLN